MLKMVDIKKVWIRKNQLRNSKHFFFLELLTVSKDRSIGIIDSATGKLEFQPEKAHEFVIFVIPETFSRVQKSRITSLKIFFLFRASINLISQIDKNLFVTGDDIGVIKLWDFHEISKNSTNFASSDIKIDDDDQKPHKPSILRSMESKPVGILSEHEDYISDFEISKNGKELIAVGCVFWFFWNFDQFVEQITDPKAQNMTFVVSLIGHTLIWMIFLSFFGFSRNFRDSRTVVAFWNVWKLIFLKNFPQF